MFVESCLLWGCGMFVVKFLKIKSRDNLNVFCVLRENMEVIV